MTKTKEYRANLVYYPSAILILLFDKLWSGQEWLKQQNASLRNSELWLL